MEPIILSIDTSCDETSAAVTMGRRILSNVIFSQVDIHQKYGGVYPALAKRAHQERIDGVVAEALKRAKTQYRKLGWEDRCENEIRGKNSLPTSHLPTHFPRPTSQLPLSAVAVTQGPGLAIALEVGITKAKELAKLGWKNRSENEKWDVTVNSAHRIYGVKSREVRGGNEIQEKNPLHTSHLPTHVSPLTSRLPLIAINHLEGHILSTIAQNSMGNPKREIKFPALALIVSGGNTQLVLINEIGDYKIVGETLDDACGEALDKAARILKLGYPGGPIIERLAKDGDPTKYPLKPALVEKSNLNFSYSGLKTSFLYLVSNMSEKEFSLNLKNLAASFQYSAFEQLTRKLSRAIEIYQPNTVICGGGVVANLHLRNLLRQNVSKYKLPIYYTKAITAPVDTGTDERSSNPPMDIGGQNVTNISTVRSLDIYFPVGNNLYGDNAAMIGIAAYYKFLKRDFIKPEELDRIPRFPLNI